MFSTTLRAVHKANGDGLWRMRLEPPLSPGYIEISISSWHQIRLAAQEVSAFQNPDEVSRILANCQPLGFLHISSNKRQINFMRFKNNNFAENIYLVKHFKTYKIKSLQKLIVL